MLLATKAKIAPWGCYLSTKETSQGLCAKSLSILSVRHSGAGGTNSGACHLTIHCSCSVFVANSLWPHGPQHARPPHPSPSPGTCPSSCSLHQWCHPAISSSDTLFSFCPQSFPASWTFPVSHLFTSDDQNTGASASASVLLVNIQDWSLLRLTVLLSLLSKGLWGVFFSTTVQRINSLVFCLFTVQLSQPYMTTGKIRALTIWTFADRIISLLFNTLCLSLLYCQEAISSDFTAAVTIHSDFRAQEEEICHDFHLSPSICHELMGSDAVILVFFFFFFFNT